MQWFRAISAIVLQLFGYVRVGVFIRIRPCFSYFSCFSICLTTMTTVTERIFFPFFSTLAHVCPSSYFASVWVCDVDDAMVRHSCAWYCLRVNSTFLQKLRCFHGRFGERARKCVQKKAILFTVPRVNWLHSSCVVRYFSLASFFPFISRIFCCFCYPLLCSSCTMAGYFSLLASTFALNHWKFFRHTKFTFRVLSHCLFEFVYWQRAITLRSHLLASHGLRAERVDSSSEAEQTSEAEFEHGHSFQCDIYENATGKKNVNSFGGDHIPSFD